MSGWVDVAAVPERVLFVDGLARTDHSYLGDDDECWFLSEYLPGDPRPHHVNHLIHALKCRPSRAAAEPLRKRSKHRAMCKVADALRQALDRAWVEGATWVPIPPSRATSDPDYDDRLSGVLQRAFCHYDLDLRAMLRQRESRLPDHLARGRQSFHALYELIQFDPTALAAGPPRARIVLFDDVLTSGKHYKCCQRRLREQFAGVPICGLFIARRALPDRLR